MGNKVALTIADGFIQVYIDDKEDPVFIESLSFYDKRAATDAIIIYGSHDVLQKEQATCGHPLHEEAVEHSRKKNIPQSRSAMMNCYDIDYAVASDYLRFLDAGSVSNVEAQVVAITNNVNLLYDNEFADVLQFRISGQVIIDCNGCDPWTSNTDANILLPDFRNWCIANLEAAPFNITYDVSSLWTDRDFNGSTKGLAYTSPAICSSNKTNNVLEHYTNTSSTLQLLATHELGHNFSATHDPSGSNTIMAPSLNTAQPNWSAASVSDIQNRYQNNNGCLTTPCAPNTPEISWVEASSSIAEVDGGVSGGPCNLPYTELSVILNKSVYSQSPIDVSIDVDPSSTVSSSDYQLITTSVTFTSSTALNQPIIIRIFDDVIEESDETLILSFTISSGNATVGAQSTHTVTVVSPNDQVNDNCCSGAMTTTIGNWALSSSYTTAFNNIASRARWLISASELTAAGMTAGPISQLDLYVQTKNSTLPVPNFRLGVTGYNGTSLPSNWIATQEVFFGDFTTNTGWTSIPFSNDFIWDGTSGIYVETCFDGNSGNSSDFVRMYTGSSGIGGFVTNYFSPICTTGPAGFQSFNYKPQVRLYTSGGAIIESQAGKLALGNLKVGDTGHFYSDEGKVIASLKNIGQQDIDCIEISIETAGNGQNLWNFGGSYTQKTWEVIADNEASYEITVYFTPNELAIWGGQSLQVVKSNVPFVSATREDLVVTEPLTITNNIGQDDAIGYKASFSGFSRFALTDIEDDPVPYTPNDIVIQQVGAGVLLTSPSGLPYLVYQSSNGQLQTVLGNTIPVGMQSTSGNLYINTNNGAFFLRNPVGSGYTRYRVNDSGTITTSTVTTLPSPSVRLGSGSIAVAEPGAGLILKSSGGQCYKLSVTDIGVLEVILVACSSL